MIFVDLCYKLLFLLCHVFKRLWTTEGRDRGDIFKIQKITKFFGFLFSPHRAEKGKIGRRNFVNGVLFSSL